MDLVEVSLAGIRLLSDQRVFLWWAFSFLVFFFPESDYSLPLRLALQAANRASVQAWKPSCLFIQHTILHILGNRIYRANKVNSTEAFLQESKIYFLRGRGTRMHVCASQAFALSRALRFLSTLLMFPMHVFALFLRQPVINFVNSTSSAPAALNNFFCLFV